MSTFQILHISDLHVSAQGNFDRSVVLDPLISRVEMDIDAEPKVRAEAGEIFLKSQVGSDWVHSQFFVTCSSGLQP